MHRILPGIDTLDQHLYQLEQARESYRPKRCPNCGMDKLWFHGCYYRQPEREGKGGGNRTPIPILRFSCPHCGRTCSRLPSCIPPRRWYPWALQQAALVLVLSGTSLCKASSQCPPDRRTISRWWNWLKEQFSQHSHTLRSRFPELGRHTSLAAFWSTCFHQMPLADAMTWLDQDGVVVP